MRSSLFRPTDDDFIRMYDYLPDTGLDICLNYAHTCIYNYTNRSLRPVVWFRMISYILRTYKYLNKEHKEKHSFPTLRFPNSAFSRRHCLVLCCCVRARGASAARYAAADDSCSSHLSVFFAGPSPPPQCASTRTYHLS